jgi:hypothetical protein
MQEQEVDILLGGAGKIGNPRKRWDACGAGNLPITRLMAAVVGGTTPHTFSFRVLAGLAIRFKGSSKGLTHFKDSSSHDTYWGMPSSTGTLSSP